MRIFIDIGHPAHVHYFRNFIIIMKNSGHEFYISARKKEVSQNLLDNYGIKYFDRGTGSSNLFGKLLYMLKTDFVLFNRAKKFKPDIFISFASPYTAHVSKLLRKPHVSFTDTEKAKLGILSFLPFTDRVLTPQCFQLDFGKKHVRFNGFMELCYLHPNYFKPDRSILTELKVVEKNYVVLRFVSWGANHDLGQTGIRDHEKLKMVKLLSEKMNVFISSEKELCDELKPYIINISPERIHHLLSFAFLCISEGATIASECAMLGTPVIYINTLSSGTLNEQQRGGFLKAYSNYSDAEQEIQRVLTQRVNDDNYKVKHQEFIKNHIDVTDFMVKYIEDFFNSDKVIKATIYS